MTSSGGLRRVAMALYGEITYDARVLREADALARAGHVVTVYCLWGVAPADAPFRVVAFTPGSDGTMPDGSSPFLRTRDAGPMRAVIARVRWMVGYLRTLRAWGRWVVREAGPVDVWHAHDLTGLMAVAPFLSRAVRLVYDSHEVFLETGTAVRLPRPMRSLVAGYERRLVRRAAAMITVNEDCAALLGERLRRPDIVIVRNCPARWSSTPEARARLRDRLGLDASARIVMHHGMLAPSRGIEQLADVLLEPGLEQTHVVLMGDGVLRPAIAGMTRERRFGGRLHLLDAVPPADLLGWVSGADVAAIPLQRATLNLYLSTPNKLWESLAAGVPVVVSDFPGMRRVVLDDPDGPLGAICDPADPASIAVAIRSITERSEAERACMRARCSGAAWERWNWEREAARLIALYRDIAGPPADVGRDTTQAAPA